MLCSKGPRHQTIFMVWRRPVIWPHPSSMESVWTQKSHGSNPWGAGPSLNLRESDLYINVCIVYEKSSSENRKFHSKVSVIIHPHKWITLTWLLSVMLQTVRGVWPSHYSRAFMLGSPAGEDHFGVKGRSEVNHSCLDDWRKKWDTWSSSEDNQLSAIHHSFLIFGFKCFWFF